MSIRLSLLTGACLIVLSVACSSDGPPEETPSPSPTQSSGGEFEAIQIAVGDLVFDGVATGPEDGELVLMLHGFPQTSFEWRDQMPALAEVGYRAVAVDQRGYSPGARPTEVESYAIGLLVQDVFGMVDELGYQSFHLAGHDWGANVAWVAAMTNPERVASITAVSVPHPAAFAAALADPAGEQAGMSGYVDLFRLQEATEQFVANDAALLRGIFGDAGLTEDEVEVYVDALGTEEAIDAALNWYRATDFSVGSIAPPVSVPTLFVWGVEDTAIGRQAAEAGGDYVTGPYRFEALEGIGHWLPEQAADQFTSLLLEHLEELE